MKTSTSHNHLMEPTTRQTNGLVLGAIALFVTLLFLCMGILTTLARAETDMRLPVISAETHGLQPLIIDNADNTRHLPDLRLPALTQHLPTFASPNSEITQQIVVHNDEAHSRLITITQQLPIGLEPVSTTEWNPHNIQWQPTQRRWTWTGEVAGGNRDYKIAPTTTAVPYLDLATFGIENICDQFAEVDENDITTISCNEASVTLNIGRQGQSVLLYGTAWRSLTLHADGFVTFDDDAQTTNLPPQIFPHSHTPLTLAPLHANYDLSYTATLTSTTQIGRWHAAVIADYLDGRDTLYVQWHDAPLAADSDTTARFALAIPLWPDDETPPDIETAFYIYDNISHPSRLIDAGYSIGIQDGAGERGMSYAHSVNGEMREYPPSPSVLCVLPVRYGDATESTQIISLRWQVSADIPADLISTVELTSDSQQPPLAHSWDTRHLGIRHQTYLPLIQQMELNQ